MNRYWIIAIGCIGLGGIMALRGLSTSAMIRMVISAAAFAWAALSVVLYARMGQRR